MKLAAVLIVIVMTALLAVEGRTATGFRGSVTQLPAALREMMTGQP
jgi:hypothetical protein